MMVGMVDTSSLAGVLRASQPPVSRRQPRPTPQPVAPTGSNRFEDLLRGVGEARFNTGKALLGTVLGALDVPVQAIGGMHRDVVQGAPTGGQSAGSRALQNYGQQVGGLVSDIFRPGLGQTPFFQPREFDAAGEAAVDRFGLEGAGAGAVRGGAAALDLLTGVAAGGVGGVGGRAAQGVGDTVQTYRGMSPQNQALYNSMLRGLYHGSRDTGANIARPFTAANRGAKDWAGNWFSGDLFATTNRTLGDQYASSATNKLTGGGGELLPGLTAEGRPTVRGARYRLSEPMESVAQRNILDLTGRTLDEVDPALYQRLLQDFSGDISREGTDLAKMVLSGDGLQQSRYSERLRPIFEEFGYDTIRHLSGQTPQGDIVAPVYAFLNPQGIQAVPTLPSPARALDMTGEFVGQGLGRVFGPVDEAITATGAAVREGGETFADSLASVLNRQDPSVLPAPIRNFVEGRTGPVFRGENFPDARSFSSNPALIALFNRLGLGRVFSDTPELPGPVNRGAFSKLDDDL